MGARRREQDGALAPLRKCCIVFCALVVTAKRSDELFMHYLLILSSASGVFAPDPNGAPSHLWTPLGIFVPRPLICPPLKKSCGRPWQSVNFDFKIVAMSAFRSTFLNLCRFTFGQAL